MAVLDHAVHEKTAIEASRPYGCHGKDRLFTGYQAPNRFAGTTGNEPIWWIGRKPVPHVMSRECRYDMSLTDLRCAGCKHQGSGERYAEMVKAAGS